MKIAIAELAGGPFAVRRPSSQQPTPSAATSPPVAESSRSWSAVTDELLRLRRLEDDWDGQGAVAPASEVVDFALKLALDLSTTEMTRADRVVAGVNGTIFFEWHDPKAYLEIEVFTPDHAEGRWVFTDTNLVDEFTISG